MPVASLDGEFWQAKADQLVQFGPFDDPYRLMGRGIPILLIWLFVDWHIRRRFKKPAPEA